MVYGFGIYEKGKYRAKIGETHTKEYLVWHSMISRCYNKDYHKAEDYKDVIICEEWRYFQNFAEWFHKHYYNFEETLNLDKDFKYFAYGLDKIYSPDNCIFIPQSINKTIVFQHQVERDYPVGVVRGSHSNNIFTNRLKYIPRKSKEEAYEDYLKIVYDRIKVYINSYKNKIPNETLQVLIDFVNNDSLREMHKMQKLVLN